MNIYQSIENKILTRAKKFVSSSGQSIDKNVFENIRCEIPPKEIGADFALNMAMILARHLKKSPLAIAKEFVPFLSDLSEIEKIEIVNPGFINFIFKDWVWETLVENVIKEGENFGVSKQKNKEKHLIEFVSANPTGPLHIGHCRGAVIGNAIATILEKAGFAVEKEYYINDYGVQISNLVRSVWFRYLQHCGKMPNDFPEDCYPGEYITAYAKEIFAKNKCNLSEEEFFKNFKQKIVNKMMEIIKSDLELLGIRFDSFVSETALIEKGEVQRAIAYLGSKGLAFQGVLDKPLGKEIEDWSPKKQTLFKSTKFGDDFDRVIVRDDGSLTYFASDIAYHKNKFDRGFTKLVNVWGADHGGYVKRLKAAVSAVSENKAELEVVLCQMVNLEKNGEPFKMSKRKGTYVLASDVAHEVGADILKLFLLSKGAETQMTFDFDKVKEESKDNIIFYFNYAYGRTLSLQKKYRDTFGQDYVFSKTQISNKFSELSELEKRVVVTVSRFPVALNAAAKNRAPQQIVEYLKTLAEDFHSLWSAGDKFICPENKPQTETKMGIAVCVQRTIESALSCLTITPQKLSPR